MFIDTHAHLTSREFDADRSDVITRARDAGVTRIVNPATTLDDSRRAVELAAAEEGVYACVGMHPHEATGAGDDVLRAIEDLCRERKVVAIGEIGLDFHYDFAPRDDQERVFAAQLGIAARNNLPVVIHMRDATEETVRLVRDAVTAYPLWRSGAATPHGRFPAPKGVFHCFPGTPQLAWELIGLGFAVSLPGIVTFKKAGAALDVARDVSPEHLLLETDSPYLAPVPHRGTRNEPAYLPLVARAIADAQHLSVEDIARTTAYGAYTMFGIGSPGKPAIVYSLKNSLYINLTIRCNADCVFCDRKGDAVIKGHNLRIEREPEAAEVIAAIGDAARYDEIVFCGYGEPTIRLEALKEVAAWVKAHGGRTRLNTDGHGSVINKRNIVPELAGLIDAVSISLNSTDPVQYGELMRVDGARMFPAMVEFAREAVRLLPKVTMTIVDLSDVDRERARAFVEEEIGATFYTRPFF
ncbi:MAG TPA: TatD family hydrolase [Bacteroidota bacterium]|nr:TatD family hydrolase [Bacteroidota bacterium]